MFFFFFCVLAFLCRVCILLVFFFRYFSFFWGWGSACLLVSFCIFSLFFLCFSFVFLFFFVFLCFRRMSCVLHISRQLLSIVPQSSATRKAAKNLQKGEFRSKPVYTNPVRNFPKRDSHRNRKSIEKRQKEVCMCIYVYIYTYIDVPLEHPAAKFVWQYVY